MGKLAKTTLTLSIVLLLAAGIAIVVMLNTSEASDGQSLDKKLDYSYETEEITTDLQNGGFVRIQFQIMTDSQKAGEEVEKREFQIKNMLIKELTEMDEEDFKSGLPDLEDNIQKKLNDVMEEGQITDVYTTDKILQQAT